MKRLSLSWPRPAVLAAIFVLMVTFTNGAEPNRVLSLDGQTAFLEVADSPALHSISNGVTIELWFKARSFPPGNGAITSLLRKNVTAGSENFFLRFRTINREPVLEFSPGVKIGTLRAPFRFRPDTWYHLAATYDGTTARAFVNGAQVQTTALSGRMTIDSSDLMIGRGDPEFSAGEFFDGALDEIRLWNLARSQTQLQAAATLTLTGENTGLVAYWNFDDSTALDQARHTGAGVLKGAAQIVESARPTALEAIAEAEPASTPPSLSSDKRLAALEDLWRHLSEIYPALEYKGIFGREWIEPTAERVRQVKGDEEFYDLLLQLMASLKDTHTRIISYPNQPSREAPPVQLGQVEGKVAVIRAHESTGLKAGDVLVAVDDKPAADCLALQLQRVCNSTDRGRFRAACSQLLAGRPGTEVTLKVEGPDKALRQVTLSRERNTAFLNEPALSWRRLEGSLGYIRISRWGGANLVAQFDQALEELKNSKGLVIDVRGNGGGSDALADEVNGRFIEKPVVSSIDFWRQPGTNQFRKTIGRVLPRGPWAYRGRVAVLIDEGCASACEHFVSGMEAMLHVLLVGTPTNGAGGGPTLVELCDGTKVAISRALGLRANGVVFEGHGIPPHIFSTPSLEDLRRGRDAALDISKAWLLSDDPVPVRSQPLPAQAL